jgi:hypothetical protein
MDLQPRTIGSAGDVKIMTAQLRSLAVTRLAAETASGRPA